MAIAIMKILALFLGIGIVFLLYRYASIVKSDKKVLISVILISLNPLLWIEGIGQAHNDLLVAFFIAAWLIFAAKNQYILSGLVLGFATASKITAIILVGMYVIYLMRHSGSTKFFSLIKGVGIGILIFTTTAFLYIPVWEGPDTLLKPLNFLTQRGPTNNLYKIFYSLGVSFGGEKSQIIRSLSFVCMVLSCLIILIATVLSWRATTFRVLVGDIAKVWIMVVLFAAQFYHSWYLLPCLILVCELKEHWWRQWFFVFTTSSILCEGSALLAPNSLERVVFVVFTTILQALLISYLLFKIIPKWHK